MRTFGRWREKSMPDEDGYCGSCEDKDDIIAKLRLEIENLESDLNAVKREAIDKADDLRTIAKELERW